MSGRWWRAYGRARHDPKLLKLTDKQFRWWFSLVCVASDNDGVLPSHADLAVEFRVSGKVMTEALDSLVAAGLFDHDETGVHPHNWNGLQYKSDVSNERVKRFRERQGNAPCNVTETPSESEAETEQIQSSVAKATGEQASPKDQIFREYLPWMNQRAGKDCRSVLGQLCSSVGDDDALAALRICREAEPVDPVAWIKGRMRPRESNDQRKDREIREAIERSKLQ